MENQKKKPEWYNKKSTVILWCIFFFPVGLYAIWKSSVIPKGWKIGYTILIAILFIISQNKEKTNKNNDVKTDKIANAIKVNIDSLINLVKKDSLFDLKLKMFIITLMIVASI
ncbi:MAG: hypothetical protein P4L28_10780 [Paludibacteraceae bacterium]|nr:hypothetical protein [Paludibacteraceae bacterium]